MIGHELLGVVFSSLLGILFILILIYIIMYLSVSSVVRHFLDHGDQC